jgi:hypothetical protein
LCFFHFGLVGYNTCCTIS